MTAATSTEIKLDFSKLDGLLPGIVQDAATGAVLMVGFLNEESYQKTYLWLRHLLEPHPQQALDEGRDQRQPSAHCRNPYRLRHRHAALPRRC